MSLRDVLENWEEINRMIVIKGTFGHLDQEPGTIEEGSFVYTITEWGTLIPISSTFQTSPLHFFALNEFIFQQSTKSDNGIYKFKGIQRRFKNGNVRFKGKISKIHIKDK